MRCCLWAALLLASCGGRDAAPPVPEIAVYRDRFEFRGETYTSVSALSIGLAASSAKEIDIDVRECVLRERLVDLVAMLRRGGHSDVAFELPEDC